MGEMGKKINQYWSRWVKQRALSANPQQFNSGNLYIVPSVFGLGYAVVLLTLFLCAINYQVSSVFFLTFLLAVAGMVSAWEAHGNLKGLAVHCLAIEDAYQYDTIKIVLLLRLKRSLCYALEYYVLKQEKMKLEKITNEGAQITLCLPARERGCFQLPRITFCSYFPLGLFRVWGYIYFDANYYVYPLSVSPGFWPKSWQETVGKTSKLAGNEEVNDLKPVLNPWTQPSRIAWKIAARGHGWYLKTMVGSEGNYWLFRIQDLPTTSLEENLQHLSYWVQTAENKGYFYGLELKGLSTNVSQGPAHLTHCLRLLASY